MQVKRRLCVGVAAVIGLLVSGVAAQAQQKSEIAVSRQPGILYMPTHIIEKQKLIEKLGSGDACPHGNVVGMDSPGLRRSRGLKPLEEATARERLTIASVFERDRKLLEFLDGQGIRPGVRVDVVSAGEEIELRSNGKRLRVERPVAARIWVRNSN